MGEYTLPLLTFAPLVGTAVILFLPKSASNQTIKWSALGFTVPPLIISLLMLAGYDRTAPGVTGNMQFLIDVPWIESIGISFKMGVDGLSVPLILLTTLLTSVSIIASWGIEKQCRGYFALFLLLEMSMLGVFVALDFFLFYVFWEIMLVPMYFLIGIWGGPNRRYAAIKFFLYTLVGSLAMLLAIIAMYFKSGLNTFDMLALGRAQGAFTGTFAIVIWVALFVGFAIKVPIFPFHTWLPDAHVEAPTAVSVILAAVLLKMGTYGLLRVNFSMLMEATRVMAPYMSVLGVVGIVYASFVAMAQSDLKKLIAYSSVGHMGFVILGMGSLTQFGMTGAMLQMINHGMVTAGLFLLVGVVYDQAHTRQIDAFGGLAAKLPVYTGFVTLAFFASLGLPGLCSFWGEFLVIVGSYNTDVSWLPACLSPEFFKILVYCAAFGIVITAAYHLWAIQRMFLGPFNEKWSELKDMNKREILTLVPTAIFAIVIGIVPGLAIGLFDSSITKLVNLYANMGGAGL